MNKFENKRGYENSFAWIFAIIAGAMIIFLALYAVTNFIKMFNNLRGSESGLEIGILLTPFETSIEEGKINSIKAREVTEIYNDCNENGDFGIQKISVKTKSRIGKEDNKGVPSSFKNKYLFSEKILSGKEFYILSKPLDFPFKVGDIIIGWSKEKRYCFVDLRNYQNVKKEINGGNFGNIVNVTSINDCDKKDIKVCFGYSNKECNITIENNKVINNDLGKEVYISMYNDNTGILYAAIFSDVSIYNCQIKRLAKRAILIESLYEKKSNLDKSLGGCGSFDYLGDDLVAYRSAMNSLSISNNPNINSVEIYATNLDQKNVQNCQLY